MKKIAVLSDTHLSSAYSAIPYLQQVRNDYFPDADCLLHAGDIIGIDPLLAFEDLPFYVVRGNMDPPDALLPAKRVVELFGFRIGLIHGWGAPEGIEQRALGEFHGERLDALVYGHSHYPVCHSREGILIFNPGSLTDRRRAPWCSLGILELDGDIRGRHIRVDPSL